VKFKTITTFVFGILVYSFAVPAVACGGPLSAPLIGCVSAWLSLD